MLREAQVWVRVSGYPDTLIPVEYFVLNFPVINLQQKAKNLYLYIYIYI